MFRLSHYRLCRLPLWGLPLLLVPLALFPLLACSRDTPTPVATVAEGPPPVTPPPGQGVDLVTAIEQVAERTVPAVVHIDVIERQEVANPLYGNPFFQPFFGNQRMPKKFQRELRGLGTGILMDADGLILTNNHVAGGATKIEVELATGERYTGELVGADPKTDLAVVRIHVDKKLPFVTFGDSDGMKVGQWVVAIGHPRGLDQTVTQGIISAKHRSGIVDPSGYQDFLQTDAAINPGNSGGPLLNLAGEVIGINAAIESASGGSEGIGFAIPSNMALHVARQLIANGKVTRGWLGVSLQDLTPDLATSFGLSQPRGALIADVVKDGPAQQGGLQRGDVITGFNGRPIADATALRNQVATAAVGSEATLTLRRDGQERTLQVRIGNLADAVGRLAGVVEQRLGVKVRAVPQQIAVRYGLRADQGVEITAVDHDGPLGAAGFEVNDLILAVGNRPVTDVLSFAEMVRSLKSGQQIELVGLDHRSGDQGVAPIVVR